MVDIGKTLGVSNQTVSQRLEPYKEAIKGLNTFKKNEPDLITMVKRNVLFVLGGRTLEKASDYQLAGIFGLLDERERLARDKTTQNIGMLAVIQAFPEILGAITGELGRRGHDADK